jgi:hypothetical protein
VRRCVEGDVAIQIVLSAQLRDGVSAASVIVYLRQAQTIKAEL